MYYQFISLSSGICFLSVLILTDFLSFFFNLNYLTYFTFSSLLKVSISVLAEEGSSVHINSACHTGGLRCLPGSLYTENWFFSVTFFPPTISSHYYFLKKFILVPLSFFLFMCHSYLYWVQGSCLIECLTVWICLMVYLLD